MDDLYKSIFGSGKRKRGIARVRLTVDKDGKPVFEPLENSSSLYVNDESFDTVEVAEVDAVYNGCGCSRKKPFGGQCMMLGGCSALSCSSCHGTCALCALPICPEHSRWFREEERETRLCLDCYGQVRRKRLVEKVKSAGAMLLSPFVDSGGKEDS